MKEQKNLSYSLRKVPILSLPGLFAILINVNYVKNAIFENYFEHFSHFSIV